MRRTSSAMIAQTFSGKPYPAWCREVITSVMVASLALLCAPLLLAQTPEESTEESGPKPITVSGTFTAAGDLYGASGDSTFRARQESVVGRLSGRITVRLFDQIELPFEAYLSTEGSGYRQPFNQFGVSPRFFGWLTLHAGWFSTRLSDMSFGDERILGAGIEATPGGLRLAALYGYTQLARQPDSIGFFEGSFERKVIALKLGGGKESQFSLNLLHAIDDTNSIRFNKYREDTTIYSLPTPKENLLATIAVALPFADEVRLDAEVAASAYSEDITSPALSDQDQILPESFFTTRISSFFDLAAKAGVMIRPVNIFTLRLGSEWIGPGYRTLGYPQFQSDVFQWTASPTLRLLDGDLFLSGSIGLRTNNLRDQKLAPTTRVVGSGTVSAQLTEDLGLDASYSSYSFKSGHVNDTLKMNNVFNSFSLGPCYQFNWLDGRNTVSANYAFQTTEDLNPITSQGVSDVHAVTAVHSLALENSWTFTTNLFYNLSDADNFTTNIFSIGESVGTSLLENKMSVSIGGSLSLVGTESRLPGLPISNSSDSQWLLRTNGSWRFNDWGTLGAALSMNNYNSDTPGRPSYTEYRGRVSVTAGF